MTQFVVRHIAPEMAALGLLELLLTFALAYILLSPADVTFHPQAFHQALIFSLTVGFIAFVVGLYRPQIFERARGLIINTVVSALLSFPAVWVVSKALGLSGYWPVSYDTFRPVKIVLIWCGALVSIRILFLMAARLNLFVHRVAIVGAHESGSVRAAVEAGRKGFLEVTVLQPDRASLPRLSWARIRTLVVANRETNCVSVLDTGAMSRQGISVIEESAFFERHLRRVNIDGVSEAWFAAIESKPSPLLSQAIERAFDIFISLGLLVTTLPLMIVVALLVRLDSPGPVLYRQERVGLSGRPFTLLKFRSMRVNAEAGGPAWAQARDPRVTRVGSFMRKSRIDELPQLINILRGEMSFIGPRPERPHFVAQLSSAIPFYAERARVKPGLTGWAQVNYPYGASIEDARAKLSYDLYYVKNRSLVLDILILLSTVRVILFQEGAR